MSRWLARLAALAIVVFLYAGCGSDSRSNAVPQSAEQEAETASPAEPEVSTGEAEAAVSDAMLASSLALFLAFQAEPGATTNQNEIGTLVLEWDERADFSSGVGIYTITMNNFSVAPDEVPGASYNGYVLSGSVVMGSEDGVNVSLEMDLQATHEFPDTHPVNSISILLEGVSGEPSSAPEGYVRINGEDREFRDLLGSIQSGL